MIKEASFILMERYNDLPEDSEKRLRLCAIRIRKALDTPILAKGEK